MAKELKKTDKTARVCRIVVNPPILTGREVY